MNIEAGSFFEKMPQALPLFDAFAEKVLAKYPDAQVRVQKSQISFSNQHRFVFVWLPIRKMKGRPDVYIIVFFGLARRLDSPRIIESVESYPNRWMHHVIIQNCSEIDTELMSWISEAYHFESTQMKKRYTFEGVIKKFAPKSGNRRATV